MKKRNCIILILTICLVLFSAGCKPQENEVGADNGLSGDSKQAYGHDVTSISLTRFQTMNPILNTEKPLNSALKLVYDSLFEIDEKDNATPQIASSYNWSQDRKSVEINIKSGIKWHDGQSLTADDVAFTIERIKSAQGSPYGDLVKDISSVKANSSQSIYIEFTKPDTSLIRNLIFPIIPKHRLAGLSADAFEADENNLVGSGMYKINDFQKRKMIVLKRNEEYYAQKPKIEMLRLLVVPDGQAQSNMFMSREIDFYDDDMFFNGKYGSREVKTIEYFSGEFEFLAFNMKKEKFSNVELRKALIRGIDRVKMLEEVYLGKGAITEIPVNPQNDFYDESIKPYGYDASKTKEYVKAMQPPMEPIELLVNVENDQRVKAAYTIKKSLAEAGVDIQVVEKTWEEYAGDLRSGNYDMAIAGWKMPVSGTMRYCFHSQGQGNILGYSSEKIDGIINEIEYTEDQNMLAQKYSQLQLTIRNDIPYIPLVLKKNTVVISDRIEGISAPSSFNIYRGMQAFSMVDK